MSDQIRTSIEFEADEFVQITEDTPLGRAILSENRKTLAAWCRKDRVGWQLIPLLGVRVTRSAIESTRSFVECTLKPFWEPTRPKITDARASVLNARAEAITGIRAAQAFVHNRAMEIDPPTAPQADAAFQAARDATKPLTR